MGGDILTEFVAAMHEHGLEPADGIIAEGKLHSVRGSLCGACYLELEGRADDISKKTALLASEAGASAPRLPVRPHLRPKPRPHLSRPELELALECTRQAAGDLAGWWWQPTDALPAMYVEAFATWASMSAPFPPHIDFDEPDDELLTDWERSFRASIDAWEGELAPRQQEKLDEIEQPLEIRRRNWRDGLFPRYVR